MRTATNITINRAIIHGVNPRIPGGFVLSEACMPFGQTHPIAKFLSNHIQNALQDQAIRAARFKDGAGSNVDDFRRILEGKKNFVDASKAIATTLHDLVNKDKRLSPGALAMCFYQAGNDATKTRCLAVLKLDQGEAFKQKTDVDKKGRKYVTLDELKDVMPRTGERLQKCAFIRPLHPRPEDYDMMVLDRQGSSDEPAQFFTRDLLKALLASDPATLTRTFHRAALQGLNSVRGKISHTDYERLRIAINGAVHSLSIDINDWGKKLRAPTVALDAVLGSIRRNIPDATIDTDATTADELTKTRIIRGKHHFKLTFDAAHEQDIIHSSTPKKDSNKGAYQEVVLHVQDYREEGK